MKKKGPISILYTVASPNNIQLFLVFTFYGVFAVGPLQFYNVMIEDDLRAVYKVGVPLVSIVIALLLRRRNYPEKYSQVFYGFFVASSAFLLQWLVFRFVSYPITVENLALEKIALVTMTIVPIMVLTKISGKSLGSVMIKKGKLKQSLIIGLGFFTFFAATAVTSATSLFNSQGITIDKVLGWAPWILLWVLSNGLLEESIYRGLFLEKYGAFFGLRSSNLLQSIIFCSIHLEVAYIPEPYLFVLLTFLLGLAWGYIVQRTESILGSLLFHAGTDIPIIISIFSTL